MSLECPCSPLRDQPVAVVCATLPGAFKVRVGRNDPCRCGSGKKYKHCCFSRSHGGGVTPTWLPRTDAEFSRLVTSLDDHLCVQDVPIPERPESAIELLSRSVGAELNFTGAEREPVPGCYSGDDLVIRIKRWYAQRYKGALEPGLKIRTEEEFLGLIEKVDFDLRSRGIPITGRPIMAIGEFCRLLKAELSLSVAKREPVAGRCSGVDLVLHIERWYDNRYGESINMVASSGEVIFLARGDPWVFRLPLILGGGSLSFFCEFGRESTLPSSPQLFRQGQTQPVYTYNILDAAVDLPSGLAKSLSEAEREELRSSFLLGWDAYEALRELRSVGMVEKVRGDLSATVAHLAGRPSQSGLAKWAALQATEKMLKTYISEVHGKFPPTHNLAALAAQAVGLGLPALDDGWIQSVQCPAGVRYGDSVVSLNEAVLAHHASLRIVAHIGAALKRLRGVAGQG